VPDNGSAIFKHFKPLELKKTTSPSGAELSKLLKKN